MGKKEVALKVSRDNEILDFNFILDKNPTTGSGMLGIQPVIIKEKTN